MKSSSDSPPEIALEKTIKGSAITGFTVWFFRAARPPNRTGKYVPNRLFDLSTAMPEPLTNSSRPWFRRAIEFWPYVFIAISLTGLAYIALTAVR